MDTQEKIAELKALRDSLKDGVSDQLAKAEALDTAILVLEGTLETQAIELENKYKATIDTLKEEKEAVIAEKEILIQEKEDLQEQIDSVVNENIETV